MDGKDQGNVRVVCRVRPLNATEMARENATCLKFPSQNTIKVQQPGKEDHNFTLDRIFAQDCTQQDIFNYAAKPVIDSVLEGFNGTVFAYGQTSSGKTHTMQGPNIMDKVQKGIIPRMVDTVFDHICQSPEHIEYRLRISIVEIYMEKIKDLLDITKQDLKIREKKDKGIYIEDVTEKFVASEQEVYNLMNIGNSHRSVSATMMNQGSSRSHLVFILTINMTNINDYSSKTGKLSLIDLAGSEKISKTGATGLVMEEGKKINLSLTTLGNVINALTDGKSAFIPYRNSKLTRVLQESLGGNSKTTLIVTASPSPFNSDETISTLRFGSRAKAVQNKAKVNRELTVGEMQLMLQKAENTIAAQKRRITQLEMHIKNNQGTVPEEVGGTRDEQEEKDEQEQEDQQEDQQEKQENGERIQQLEMDLERERESVKVQSEKLNNVKNEFDMMNVRFVQMTADNKALSDKVAEMETNMINQEITQLENQDEYIEELEKKIAGLKEDNEAIKQQNKTKVKKAVGEEAFCQTIDPAQLGQKFLDDLDVFQNELPGLTLVERQVLETVVKREFEETFIDRPLFDQIYSVVKNFKENVFGILEEDIEKDAQDLEMQVKLTQVDLKRKDDKIKHLEQEVKKLRDTNNHLNKTMSNGEKNLNQKMKNLEVNVEQLTQMYNQLMKNRSELKAHAYNQEKKLKRKEELIKKFQTALQDEKNYSYQFRSKYETLKTMVCQNDLSEHLGKGVLGLGGKSESREQKEEEQNVSMADTSMLNQTQEKRIIKHIRGGQNRMQNKDAKQKFIQSKLQND